MKTNNNITLSPYRRITATGCDIAVLNHSHTFVVQLKRGAEIIANGKAPRGGGTAAAALEKARLNKWGQSSSFYALMTEFADIAENLAGQEKQ